MLGGLGIGIRIVLGGLASLITTRARNFVSAGASLMSPEEIQKARRFLEGIEDSNLDTSGQ